MKLVAGVVSAIFCLALTSCSDGPPTFTFESGPLQELRLPSGYAVDEPRLRSPLWKFCVTNEDAGSGLCVVVIPSDSQYFGKRDESYLAVKASEQRMIGNRRWQIGWYEQRGAEAVFSDSSVEIMIMIDAPAAEVERVFKTLLPSIRVRTSANEAMEPVENQLEK